ncbi:MAG: helix-turn-helix transcriptional regulator [Hahellaceae bacterium]|nr:helix-turn-helix transcriptional regulator [Hahellaceae bacterium]
MKLQDRVALRIRTIRKRRGLTQEQLAEQIDRSGDSISQLERGISLPSFATLERLALVLNTPIQDFFDDETGKGSPQRIESLAIIIDIVRQMTDKELQMAVQVLEAVGSKRTKRKSKT